MAKKFLLKHKYSKYLGCIIIVNNMNKQELFENIKSILDHYCEGCFLHKHLKKEYGRRTAHRFCILNCTIGENLKELGGKLS